MMTLSAATPRVWLPAIVFLASTVFIGQRYREVIWNINTPRASKVGLTKNLLESNLGVDHYQLEAMFLVNLLI